MRLLLVALMPDPVNTLRHFLLLGLLGFIAVGCASRPEGVSRENWRKLTYREKLKVTNRDALSWSPGWTSGMYTGLDSRNLERQEGNPGAPFSPR